MKVNKYLSRYIYNYYKWNNWALLSVVIINNNKEESGAFIKCIDIDIKSITETIEQLTCNNELKEYVINKLSDKIK